MYFNKLMPVLLMLALPAFLLFGCGMEEKNLSIEGTVDLSGAADRSGPVFVALARGNDLDTILSDPLNSIKEMVPVDKGASAFYIDLSQSSLSPGDEVVVISFIDNDYADGVPYPGPGDYLGVYLDRNTFKPSITLGVGVNDGIAINVCRAVYSYEAVVSGTVEGPDTGRTTVIAYAGEIASLDMGDLDFDAIIGFQEIQKGAGPAPFSFPVLPYGYAAPVQNVYLIALIDTNGNGMPDGGDRLGFYSTQPDGLPTIITINEGENSGYAVTISASMPVPSGSSISLKGFFQRPSGYDQASPPVFLIVSDAADPNLLFSDPLSAIKSFYRLPAGEYSFDIDLSETGLSPGNNVTVMALWDRDYTAGFPSPTAEDRAGFYQNNATMGTTITLAAGENLVEPFGDYEFSLNRIIYDHDASISFQFDNGGLPAGDELETGDQVIAIAVHEDGYGSFAITDMDYIVAMSTITIDDPAGWYSLPVLPAIYDSITVADPFGISDLYLFAILDSNKNGMPDEGEYIGYYWDWLVIYFPKKYSITDGMNNLDKTVRFSNTTY